MTFTAYPGKVFNGKVSFVYPFMEAKTRTMKVRIEVGNPEMLLKPDMYADVTLKPMTGRSSLVVPAEAVILSGERSIVILARGGGRFAPRVVTLGVEAGGYYEVLKGLSEGDEVVTSAHFLIDSESRLKEAIGKMLDVKGGPGEKARGDGKQGGGDMKGMDHSGMDDSTVPATGNDMQGHDMKDMGHEGMDMKERGMEGMGHDGQSGHSGHDSKDMGRTGHSM